MPEIIKSRALILNSIRWQESSKIVSLYSREWGKIKVIARGALRNKSPFSGKLEALNLVDVIVSTKSSRSLQILTEVDLVESFNQLRLQLERFPYALAILEIINQVFDDEHPNDVFFDFTVNMINNIASVEKPEIVFCYFLLKLSSFLGFKPNFDQCKSCASKNFAGNVYFSIEQGAVYCADCAEGAHLSRKLKPWHISFLQRLQKYPHKRIAEFKPPDLNNFDYTSLLIEYLSLHLDQKITLNSFSMLI